MLIFVTGASGFIGSAVTQELLAHGYRVLGLARSDESANKLRNAGAEVHRGDLTDPNSLRDAASSADGIIHTAFDLDMSRFAENCAIETSALQALGDAFAGSSRPLIATAGVALLAPGRTATEDDMPPPPPAYPRATDATAAELAARGVHTSVVRLPPCVHGEGDTHGFVPIFTSIAKAKGCSAYVGAGENLWPAVHRLDAAVVFRLALQRAALGATYHAIAEEGVAFREMAGAIALGLNLPLTSVSAERAGEHFGWAGMFAGMDLRASSDKTREQLGWSPARHSLLQDLEGPMYFDL